MCEESVKKLEEALEVQMSTNEEEMRQKKVEDKVRRNWASCQSSHVKENEEDKVEEEEEDKEGELESSSRLSVKARGKCPMK